VVTTESGAPSFRTQGTNNNVPDKLLVPEENLVGRYTGVRIPFAGNVAIFMQTTYGLIVCVFIPFILIVGYDIMRRRKNEKEQNDDLAALMAELNALKAEKAAASSGTDASASEKTESVTSEEKSDDETVILPSEATSGD
jgi:signal peptidase